jgi:voltage-gated potassium channel
MSIRERLIRPTIAIVGIISFGTAGYVLIEDWTLFDSLYMTIITLTTVGYEEVHHLSDAGKTFTIFLVLSGVGVIFYALGVAARVILEGEIREILGRKRLSKKIENLKDHYIICGYGRMGSIICKELMHSKSSFVVVEGDSEIVSTMDADILVLHGDATQDSILQQAGIEKAKGLISVLQSDASNLYVVLSARGLNPKLKIVARAGEEGAEQKLVRAGADKVISPYYLGGLRIAQTLLKPSVVDFIEFATKSSNIEIQIEEVRVKDGSGFIGQTLDECGLRKKLQVIIVAIKRESGEMEFNPTSTSVIQAGDTLIAMGEQQQLKGLEELMGA